MKKIIISSVFLLFCLSVNLLAWTDLPRTSHTETAEQNAVIATGTVKMYIVVEMAGEDSSLEVFGGGSSTATATKIHNIDTTWGGRKTYEVEFSTPRYNNKGTVPAKVNFYWDWVGKPPTGQEGKGRH